MEYSKCPKCHATIEKGVTICGNCKSKIVWKDGDPKISFSQQMDQLQKSSFNCGCAATVLITIPIIILFLIAGC